MNSKFLLAAICAVTISLGFTACDDDDDNNNAVNNSYSMTYSLHFGGMGDDLDETIKAYYDATGLAYDCEEETFTVLGTDSADCAQNLLEMTTTAEETLSSKTDWEESVNVSVFDSDGTNVYAKVFGANGDNLSSTRFYYYGLSSNSKVSGKYIKNYYVDSFGACGRIYNRIDLSKYNYINEDMNSYTGGRYVYIVVELTDNIDEAVTGAFVLVTEFETVPTELTYNGVVYTCSSEVDGDPLPNYRNRDLNEQAGGKWIYLYTTHDKRLGRALLNGSYACYSREVYENGAPGTRNSTLDQYGFKHIGDVVEFMPGSQVCTSQSDLDNIKLRYRDSDYNLNKGADMNESAGGDYLYVAQQWELHDFGTTGTCSNSAGEVIPWAQLWENGPCFAKWDIGSTKETEVGTTFAWNRGDNSKAGEEDASIDNIQGYRAYDNATAQWGSLWVTPTKAQMQALLDNTDTEFTTVDGAPGLKCTGRGDYSDNYIFFPAVVATNESGSTDLYDTAFGYYWTATSSSSSQGYGLNFMYNTNLTLMIKGYSKTMTYPVRPILQ